MDKSFFISLEQLIASSQIDELVNAILTNFEADFLGEVKNNVLLLSNQYNKATKDRALNLVDYKEYSQDQARITNAFLLVLDELRKKWEEKQNAQPVDTPPPASPAPAGLSRVLGAQGEHESSKPIAWLQQSLRAAQNVCQILMPSGSIGTGVYLGKQYLLTNNFVLPSPKEAADAIVRFFYDGTEEAPGQAMLSVRLSGNTFFTDEKAGVTIVELADDDDMPLINAIPDLPLAELPAQPGEVVSLIHHPLGGTKKIDVLAEILEVKTEQVVYRAATHPGSAGGAVLNSRNELLGIHTGRTANGVQFFTPVSNFIKLLKDRKIAR